MKKTILASAILLAGAANAAEVYNNEGTSISLGGSFRGNVAIESSDDVKFQDAGSRFDIKAAKELDNGLKAFGELEVKYSGSNGDTLYMQKAIVGLSHDVYGTATLGKQMGLNDDLVMNDFSYENGIYNEDNDLFGSNSEDQLKYSKSFSGATVVVSLMDQDTYAIGGTYEVAGLTLGGSYNIANDRTVKTTTTSHTHNPVTGLPVETVTETSVTTDNSTYILGAQYSLDALTLGVQYQASEVGSAKTSAYGIGAEYTLGQARVWAMYDILDGDAKSDEGSELVLGTDYELVKDVKAYVEFNISDNEVTGADETLWVGGRVYF